MEAQRDWDYDDGPIEPIGFVDDEGVFYEAYHGGHVKTAEELLSRDKDKVRKWADEYGVFVDYYMYSEYALLALKWARFDLRIGYLYVDIHPDSTWDTRDAILKLMEDLPEDYEFNGGRREHTGVVIIRCPGDKSKDTEISVKKIRELLSQRGTLYFPTKT